LENSLYKPYLLKDVYDASAQNKFTVISTFAGGGGSSTGYRLAGGNILCVNEFVEEARNTYKENYPNTPILPDDINKLSGQEFLDISGLDVGELDILDGSPPCSAFSMAGNVSHGKGNTHKDAFGKTKGYSDIKEVSNIEDLFFEFLRVADVIKPKVIIAENVAGLTMGEAKQYFNKIQNTFEKIGYDVCAKVLNSAYFGVPQTRNRVFFIGIRSDITLQIGLTFMNIESIFPTENKSMVILKDALNNLEYDDEEVKTLTEKFTNTAYWRDTGSKMPINPEKVLTGMDYHHKGHHFNLKRVSLEKPAPTLTAMGSNDTTAGAFHWNEPRKLTIGELKRIQSLPDDFVLTGKWNQQSERIGRMVPPLLLKSIADSVYENVIKEYKNA
jgi:DNA (cytosine-5)-methyltransferase 1